MGKVEHGSLYGHIMRLGYGPPDGYFLDKAGWRRYFDEMHPRKHDHLTHHVFADVLPLEWRPKKIAIRAEWLDGVDREVTSRSHAFACSPRYQYIWQNGYGPEDGDTLDVEGWRKYEAEMPQEKRKAMDSELFDIPKDPIRDSEMFKTYMKQIRNSEGFDVDVPVPDISGAIVPIFTGHVVNTSSFSRKALEAYNDREGTNFTLNHVVKANVQHSGGMKAYEEDSAGMMLYITFEACNPEGHTQDFQAQVHYVPRRSPPLEIVLVRPKPTCSGFYSRIMQLGYGPEDKRDMPDDAAGWRGYFNRMLDIKLFQMILHVFGDELPKEWQPEDIRAEWLDGVDKDVTSRSDAFARSPNYQYIWQHGFGPSKGDKMDSKGWSKYMAKMPEGQHERMLSELYTMPPMNRGRYHEIREKYLKQIEESEGFDVDVYLSGACGTVVPMFHDPNQAKYNDALITYSKKALDKYNHEQGTNFTLNHVVNACTQSVVGKMYYITFAARNSDVGPIQVFQAKVHQTLKESEQEIVLVRVRLDPKAGVLKFGFAF